MTFAQKLLMIIGIIFTSVGAFILALTLGLNLLLHDGALFMILPIAFLAIGLGFIIGVLISVRKKSNIRKRGTRYPAKIYGYVKNTSYMINGSYPMNTVVHYFDNYHIEREAILPTSFAKGSNLYPIGMTIDIYEYHGKFGFDPKSVRAEILPGEEELMDDKPVSPDQVQLVAVTCPNCGSSFQAAAGYSSKCPYCESYLNV